LASYLNPANAITASRYFTLPPFLYFLDRGMGQYALVMVILCGVLDLFDGPVARKLGCTSGFGEMFDAATDGICYGFFLICLMAYGKIPWIPIAIFVGLGLVNVGMRVAYARRMGRTTNYRSWAMERITGYSVYLAGLGVAEFSAAFYAWCLPAVMAVVVAHDGKRMLVDPIEAGA
jgi:phosphatidylglycerophosphate synthase